MSELACYADDIGDYRWEGIPLAEKHGWMLTGQGAAAVHPAVAALREMSARLTASEQTVRRKLAELGVTWSGTASRAAASATDRLAEWVGGVGRATAAGQGNVDNYGTSFSTMKSAIPPPGEGAGGVLGLGVADAVDGFGALVGAQTDFGRQVRAYQAADQQANAALDAHREATRHALWTFPVADAPPGAPAGSAAAAGPPGPGSAGPVGVPSDGGGASRHPVPPGSAGHPAPSGTAHPSGPAHEPGAGASSPGTSSAAAGAGPGYVPPPGPPPAPTAGPGGPIAAGPGWIGPAGRVGPGPGSGSAPPYGYRPPSSGTGAGTGARTGTISYGEPAPAPRTSAPGGASGVPGAPTSGGGPGRTGAGAGLHGAPMGMGGAAPGGAERYHRNQTFIPSDEPFHVEFADLSPPVLGVRTEDEP
jgi:hypothetical protein